MKKFLIAGAVNSIGNTLANFLAFLFNFVVVKALSMSAYGEYMSVTAYLAFFSTPLIIFSLIITKRVSQAKAEDRPLVALELQKKILLLLKKNWGIFLTLPLWWWLLNSQANFLDFSSAPTVLFLLILSCWSIFFTAVLTGWQAFWSLAIIMVMSNLVKFLGGLALPTQGDILGLVYLVLIITTLAQLIASWKLVRKKTFKLKVLHKNENIKIYPWRYYLRQRNFLIPLLGIVATTAIITLDVILVKIFAPADFAGAYALFSLFAKIMLYASSPLINVAFTFFSQPSSQKQKTIVFLLASLLISIFTLVMALLYKFFPTPIITLVGKSDYLLLSDNLWLAAIFGGLYSLAMLCTHYLIAKNHPLVFIGLLWPIIQAFSLYFYHQNLQGIMLINIATATGVILLYSFGLLKKKAWLEK